MRDALRALKKKSVLTPETPGKRAVLLVVVWRLKLVADRESPPNPGKFAGFPGGGGACWRSGANSLKSSIYADFRIFKS